MDNILRDWLGKPNKSFSRNSMVDENSLHCDCSGFINLLVDELGVKHPYGVERPKAVHYFAILQEIGSRHIDSLSRGSLLAWRKERLPKSGDTGHVLMVAAKPERLDRKRYKVSVIDATKACDGLSQRDITLHTDEQGLLIGVRLHEQDTKVKRTAMYHQSLLGSRYCYGCGLPKKMCCCGQVQAEKEIPPIVILRHPDERKRTLSTVSLIKQRYPCVLVREGELFTEMRYPDLCVLFPETGLADVAGELSSVAAQTVQNGSDVRTLVLLDATWRKAKKMLHQNEWLRNLPRVALEPSNVSEYLFRKVPTPEALSTVEAFAIACKDSDLQGLFRRFVEQQISLMGEDVYQRNYGHYLNFEEKG